MHHFLSQVNYKYVKLLAKKRSQIIQEILEATLNYYPKNADENQFSVDVSDAIETFFLTDHCMENDDSIPQSDDHKNYSKEFDKKEKEKSGNHKNTSKKNLESLESNNNEELKQSTKSITESTSSSSPLSVVPITRKRRASVSMRKIDTDELEKVGEGANLLLDDERPQQNEFVPSYSHPVPIFNSSGSKLGNLLDNNPIVFILITVASIFFLKRVSGLAVTVDLDVLLLFLWAAFCIGLHTPRPALSGIDKNYGPPSSPRKGKGSTNDVHGRRLLKRMSKRMSLAAGSPSTPDYLSSHSGLESIVDTNGEDDDEESMIDELQSPLPIFPAGAAFGSHLNCWSQPDCNNFYVRGSNYLKDRVKIESADFLWPVRGVDLFLTDTCPENVGRCVYLPDYIL